MWTHIARVDAQVQQQDISWIKAALEGQMLRCSTPLVFCYCLNWQCWAGSFGAGGCATVREMEFLLTTKWFLLSCERVLIERLLKVVGENEVYFVAEFRWCPLEGEWAVLFGSRI